MNFDDYQEATAQTAIYPGATEETAEAVNYTTLGLVGEAGECAEKVKKCIREEDPQYLRDLEAELGDVLWYVARLADELGYSLDDIAERNVEKLLDRQDRDVLTGEGDDR